MFWRRCHQIRLLWREYYFSNRVPNKTSIVIWTSTVPMKYMNKCTRTFFEFLYKVELVTTFWLFQIKAFRNWREVNCIFFNRVKCCCKKRLERLSEMSYQFFAEMAVPSCTGICESRGHGNAKEFVRSSECYDARMTLCESWHRFDHSGGTHGSLSSLFFFLFSQQSWFYIFHHYDTWADTYDSTSWIIRFAFSSVCNTCQIDVSRLGSALFFPEKISRIRNGRPRKLPSSRSFLHQFRQTCISICTVNN
jgi:hypothetical protein